MKQILKYYRKKTKFIKKPPKMFGFSELWDFLDILGRYYDTCYVEEQ